MRTFGIVTPDLREFDPTDGPECDAVEGYLMAFRREILRTVGLFDEKFRWYRTADIEYSFRIKDPGLRAVVVPVPVERHEHRMWFQTPPAGASQVVEAELLPVPRSLARALRPHGVRRSPPKDYHRSRGAVWAR